MYIYIYIYIQVKEQKTISSEPLSSTSYMQEITYKNLHIYTFIHSF